LRELYEKGTGTVIKNFFFFGLVERRGDRDIKGRVRAKVGKGG
jgi:hypothetical protein